MLSRVGPQRPQVLVAMPVFNAGAYLRPALESVQNQTFSSLAIVVADDGSTDGSLELARQISMTDDRVFVVALPHGGQAKAAEHCLRLAIQHEIPFVARMDADDLCAPERIALQVDYLLQHTDVAACGCNCFYIDTHERQIGHSTVPLAPRTVARDLRAGLRAIIQGCTVFRTSALESVGGYREQFELSEDIDLFYRLVDRYPLANLPQTLYSIRLHATSTSLRRVRLNTLYGMYALDCHNRRRAGRPEIDFASYEQQLSRRDRLDLWRHTAMLDVWRRSLAHPRARIPAMALAALLDPRRALARVRRFIEATRANSGA